MQSEFGKVEGNQRRLLDIGDSHSGWCLNQTVAFIQTNGKQDKSIMLGLAPVSSQSRE
ncbi:TPA: hypothetical protein ACGG3U_001301 [Legionella pneumophila]|uniref:hypothetical protein n=1 Tax=Legionella pneumophila TaxID=446 RepID=UPI0007707955|nr:hypothetical protein [Legionella pneumophila]WBV62313.1 hypothetical protein PGH43_10220 [Legionella pneumophila 130b]MCW8388944.1 hypothetical protein [Legionella pneumophila]MCW8466966.1 hypothetical protein [Legionella pneumophila]MCW8476631.1 hypothetical protein [Legionella pneumophila]MDW8954114.1 hypothetical protein [Legionella pneumophila]